MMDMAASDTSDFFDYEAEPLDYRKPKRRYWLDCRRIIILIVLVLLLLVIVALLVFYLHPGCAKETENTEPEVVAPVIDYRLPGTLSPSLYTLRLRPDIYTGNPATFTFSGTVTINTTCLAETKEIVLNQKNIQITHAIVTDLAANKVLNVADSRNDTSSEKYTVSLDTELKADQTYSVQLHFSGIIDKSLRGIYYTSYEVDGQQRYALASQLEATDARAVFPCFDEPSMKAAFDVIIERKSDFYSMSNGVILNTQTLDDGWVADSYNRTPVMASYLLAFVVSDFPCVNASTQAQLDQGLEVKVCCRPNALQQTGLAQEVAGPLQDFFQDYYQVPYPMPIMRHVSVPDFGAGAMENWGLILYRDYNLLYDNTTSASVHEQRVIMVIAHEIAHQWFGNLVSMAWWDDLWLNEGFASYMEIVGTQHVRPDWEMEDSFIMSKVQPVMVLDSLATSHAIYQTAQSPDEIVSLFDSITYDKGASVIRMMRYFLGENTFRSALTKYLSENKYKSTTYKVLFNYFTAEATLNEQGLNISHIMNTWILQLGYPVVTFTLNRANNKLTVSQEHFLLDPSARANLTSSPYGYKWVIPISYVTDLDTNLDDETHYDKWLSGDWEEITEPIDATAKWLIGNVKERYYYRVNYDESNWKALVEELTTGNHLSIDRKNRAQLLDDSFNLGRAGVVSQILFFNISRYLDMEDDYVAWVPANYGFSYLDRLFSVTGDYGLLRRYVQKIIQGPYGRLGWNDDASSSHTTKKMRSLIVSRACYFQLPDCLTEAERRFNEWAQDPNGTIDIPANQRYAVYCAGVAAGGQEDWDLVFSRYTVATSSDEKRNLLSALACTHQDWMLRRYIEMGMAETAIRRQDFSTVFSGVAGNTIGRSIAWELVANSWDILFERFSGGLGFDSLIKTVTKALSTEYHYDMVKSFMESRENLGSAERAFHQSLETIRSNIDWRTTNQEAVRAWLAAELTEET